MIEQKQSGAVILQDGENIQDTIKMSLDLDSVNNIMQILSKNLYSDSIGSTIRETCSNALDSHRASGVTDRPIIVTFTRTFNGNYEFTVEDFGLGLDHDDVVNVISKYGKSLKRLSDIQLGMFGLGWKSPLSYVSSFTFIVRKEGIERKYIMSEGEEENIIDLIDESDTTLENGVKVIIPVSSYDVNSFYNKIKEQLCYFESVYFNVNANGKTIDNNFKITRYKDFQLSEINGDSSLHLCLDNVYYPLDFKKLGISVINVPIGLRFGLSDGIYPTPNREQLRYTTEAKAIILEKIKTVASAVVEMYNKSVEDTDDFQKIIAHYSNDRRYIDVGHMQNVEISDLLSYSNVIVKEPHLNGVSLLNLKKLVQDKDELVSEYEINYRLQNGRMKERKHSEALCLHYFENSKPIYKFVDRLGGNKKEYIKSQIHGSGYFVKKKRTRKLFSDKTKNNQYSWSDRECKSYHSLLELHGYHRGQWRQVIKEFLLIKEIYEKQIKDADALVIPKAWLDSRKAARVYVSNKNGHQKLEGEMSCKKAEPLERYVDGKNCKFTPFSIDLGKIGQKSIFYIYTTYDNSLKLDTLFEKVKKQKVELITFSEREINKLKDADIHNLITYKKFMKGENTIFKRMVSSYLIHKLISNNSYIFRNTDDVGKVSTILSNKLCKLKDYSDTNYNSNESDDIFSAMLEVAEKYSLFDHSIYEIYKEVKTILDKFPFLDIIYNNVPKHRKRDEIVVDLLKYHKYKCNLNWYEKKEAVIEEINDNN